MVRGRARGIKWLRCGLVAASEQPRCCLDRVFDASFRLSRVSMLPRGCRVAASRGRARGVVYGWYKSCEKLVFAVKGLFSQWKKAGLAVEKVPSPL